MSKPDRPSERLANRGRLLDARTIAGELFGGSVGEQWVRRNVPKKITFTKRLIRWWERDVLDWIEDQRMRS